MNQYQYLSKKQMVSVAGDGDIAMFFYIDKPSADSRFLGVTFLPGRHGLPSKTIVSAYGWDNKCVRIREIEGNDSFLPACEFATALLRVFALNDADIEIVEGDALALIVAAFFTTPDQQGALAS